MTTPFGEIQKPDAERYRKGRKLYLVPLFTSVGDAPADLKKKIERYWSGAQEHIARLEAALGPVNRVYHEAIYLSGDNGAGLVEQFNPSGYPMIKSRCDVGAQLEATEDRALVEQTSDWQRCLSVGLISEKATTTVFQSLMEVTDQRYQHIASRIDETLGKDESAILVIGDSHRIQFPGDIQVFYVAPPALDELRRWFDNQMRRSREPEEVEPEAPDAETGE